MITVIPGNYPIRLDEYESNLSIDKAILLRNALNACLEGIEKKRNKEILDNISSNKIKNLEEELYGALRHELYIRDEIK